MNNVLTKTITSVLLLLLLPVAVAGAQPFAYIPNVGSNAVSVINTQTNEVILTIPQALAQMVLRSLPIVSLYI